MKSKQRFKKHYLKKFTPYLMISPATILIILFLIIPVVSVFYHSTQSYNVARLWEKGFIGLDNFINIFTNDKLFYDSLLISIKWVVSEVSLQLFFGLFLALLINKKFKARGIYRAIVFSPWAISGVLTSMIWSLMYNQNIGVINDLLMKLGITERAIAWLGNPATVFGAVVIAELWRGIPFFAITILASLQNIPDELYEACKVDGGGPWSELRYIILPYLKDTIILTTLLRTVWEFNNVDLIFTLTGGGPANLTTTLTMYMYNMSVVNNNYGYASALAVVAFFILLVFAIVYLKLSKFGDDKSE